MEDEERLNDFVPDSVIIEYLLKEKEEWQKERKQLLVKLGEEQSYIQELEDTIEKEQRKSAEIRVVREEVRHELAEDERWIMLKSQNLKLRERVKDLQNVRDMLLEKLNKLS